jgi:hypothetical protein
MSGLSLVPNEGPSWVELIAVRVAGAMLHVGRQLQSRYVAMVPGQDEDEVWQQAESWRLGLMAFITWAAPLNFSRSKCLDAGIVTRPGFEHYMRLLRLMGVVHTYPSSGTIWIGDWDARKCRALLRARLIEPPYPTWADAPAVLHTRVLESRPAQPARSTQPGNTVIFAKTVEGDRPERPGQPAAGFKGK